MTPRVPHLHIIVTFAIAAVAGYSMFSIWIVWRNTDPATIGDVIGTWKSFAVSAFAFWLGSSAGGKARDAAPVDVPVTRPDDSGNGQEAKP